MSCHWRPDLFPCEAHVYERRIKQRLDLVTLLALAAAVSSGYSRLKAWERRFADPLG